jgi:hypothetical protein
MVSSTWTAMAGSLTAGDRARRPMSARSRKANRGILVEGAFWPRHQPVQYGRVGRLATVPIGHRGALLKGVADAGPEHDNGAAGRLDQMGHMDLLQDGLFVWPDDRAVRKRRRGRLNRPSSRTAGCRITVEAPTLVTVVFGTLPTAAPASIALDG